MTDANAQEETEDAQADEWIDGVDAGSDEGDRDETDGDSTVELPDDDELSEYLLKGALVVLVLLALVATMQFYGSAQAAIGNLVADRYRPLFRAAFNLVVLLAAGIGITRIVRRLE